jgi:GTPase SAR1 family protein
METTIDGRSIPKLRLILLGSKKVGKTSLINQITNSIFRPEYYPTKNLTIYKSLYNFTPKSGEFDDFCYVELIDT